MTAPTPSLVDPLKPRAYDLTDPAEVHRLLREVRGYLHTRRREHHGGDFAGRQFAMDALDQIDTPLFANAPYVFDAANVALGHLTGGMDGNWRDVDAVEMLRAATRAARGEVDAKPEKIRSNRHDRPAPPPCALRFLGVRKERYFCFWNGDGGARVGRWR